MSDDLHGDKAGRRHRRARRSVALRPEPEFESAVRSGYTSAGETVTSLIPVIVRLNFEFARAQSRLTLDVGLSSARWRVLEVISRASPLHVSSFARLMQMTRQSVQKMVNELRAEGYLKLVDNPRNRQARLVALTEKGLRTYRTATMRQLSWANRLADGLSANDLAAMIRTVRILLGRLTEEDYQLIREPSPPFEGRAPRRLPAHVGEKDRDEWRKTRKLAPVR